MRGLGEERMKGLEPSTFCMASAVRIPRRVTETGKAEPRMTSDDPWATLTCPQSVQQVSGTLGRMKDYV